MTIKKEVVYHKDGSIWAKGDKVDGKCEGYWEWWRKDATKLRSGYFEKDKQIGEWKTYDRKGNVLKTTNFSKK